MARIKTVIEATWDNDDGVAETGQYYLLHWGLRYDMVPDMYGNMLPVHYTVGICQQIKTGAIEMFLPTQIRVLGVNIDKDQL